MQSHLSLKAELSVQEINDYLEHLRTHELPRAGEICHSSMAYLSYEIRYILHEVVSLREKLMQQQPES